MAKYTREQIETQGLPFALSYLLPVVNATSTITYGEIARRLQSDLKISERIFSTHIGGVAGALMNRLHEVDKNVPLINVLVVRQGKNLPGEGVDGYLRDWFGVKDDPLPPKLKAKLVSQAAQQVYSYPHWKRVYQKAFGRAAPADAPSGLPAGTERDGKTPSGGRWGGEPESEEHKALKAHIRAHPPLVGVKGRPDIASVEKRLLSYDEIDVFFQVGFRAFLVEVKSKRSNVYDFERGVYQCIKYRAVFLAQCKKVMPDVEVTAILVVEETPPPNIKALAVLNKVQIIVVVPRAAGKVSNKG